MLLQRKVKKYVIDGISNSSLSWFEVSPRYFKDSFDGLIEKDEQNYFDIGTKTHYYLLQPKEFDKLYTYLEYTTPKGDKQKQFCEEYLRLKTKGKKKDEDAAIAAYKNVYACDKKSEDKIVTEATYLMKDLSRYVMYLEKSQEFKEVLSFTTLSYLEAAKRAVLSHKLAKELIFTDQPDILDTDFIILNEYNIKWKHPYLTINGEYVSCSSTIDRMIIDHKNKKITLVDLKTTAKLSKFDKESFITYKYYRQLAFYWMAIAYMFKTEFPDRNFRDYTRESYIVALQTSTNYNSTLPIECRVFKVGEDKLKEGEVEISALLTELAWHFENDLWDYPRDYYEGDGSININ